MSKEPLVTLPLSDYHKLVDTANLKEAPFLMVGRSYEVELDGEMVVCTCQSQANGQFSLSGYHKQELRRVKIKLVKSK